MSAAAAGIAAAGAIIGQVGNAAIQGKMNKRAVRFAREQYATQRADNLTDWHTQNAYNSPASQMQRLKDGGLNPNLVYGTGADAQSQGAPRSATTHQPNFKAPQMDLGSIAFQAMQMKQIQSNIARTDAETQAIRERTAGQQFDNQLNQAIGIQNMADRYQHASDQIQISSQKANSEYQAWLAGTNNYVGKGSPAAKAAAAGFKKAEIELDNAKSLGDLRRAETIVKQFEVKLTQQGISPNSPWYVKILGDLLKTSTGMGINDFGKLD